MKLVDCYKLLQISQSATNEEITKAFKHLANKYHPDKNRDKIDWATNEMINLNIAYTTITSQRFGDSSLDVASNKPQYGKQDNYDPDAYSTDDSEYSLSEEELTKKFVKIRESAKEGLYRYFQYGLYNHIQREKIINRGRYNEIVFIIRKCYHDLKGLRTVTNDKEFIEHFDVFRLMLFNFYKASECVNILDSYSNINEVEAYRLYKKGDDCLHISHKEIFYDRHNRGHFKKELVYPLLLEAENYFKGTLQKFTSSTWAVETKIKQAYALSLKNYIKLFFSE